MLFNYVVLVSSLIILLTKIKVFFSLKDIVLLQ